MKIENILLYIIIAPFGTGQKREFATGLAQLASHRSAVFLGPTFDLLLSTEKYLFHSIFLEMKPPKWAESLSLKIQKFECQKIRSKLIRREITGILIFVLQIQC